VRSPGRRRLSSIPAGARLAAVLGVVLAVLVAVDLGLDHLEQPPAESPAAAPVGSLRGGPVAPVPADSGLPGPGGDPARRVLVLHDSVGDSAEFGRSAAVQAANLVSRGASWTIRPVERYARGEMRGYQAVVYVAYDSPWRLPAAFLSDVARSGVPVLWMGGNIEQLFAAEPGVTSGYGWRPDGLDKLKVAEVSYGGQRLLRRTDEPMRRIRVVSRGPAGSPDTKTLGTALHADGTGYPWAVSAKNLTYLGEVPFSYVDTRDRYLAAADLIQRLAAPNAPDRKRALIRIEDVGPNTDPEQIRAIADFLSDRHVPFSLATYPYYRDPHGAVHDGTPTSFRLVDVPKLVDALRYATERGGTIIMHGYTHQFESMNNPYTGQSSADYEFYTSHVDPANNVQLDGPVPGDSEQWALDRMAAGRGEFARVGLPDPDIFEFPHYMGSEADYQAVQEQFGIRYDQGTYFAHGCTPPACTVTEKSDQQYFPYPVRDVYGSVVIPENLENISMAYNNNPERTAQDLVDGARAMTVVRDSVASCFFHPFLPVEQLDQVVTGIQALGFSYVSPRDILDNDGR
jgi:uncharacterized protein YdaL